MVIETFQKKLSHLFVNLNVDSDSSSNDSLSSSLSGGQSVRDVSRKLDGSSTRRTTEEFEAERKKKIDFTARLIAGGLGSGIAETVTLPTDVVKVRMQISHNINPSASASASPGPPAAGKKTPPPPNKKTPSIRSFSSFSSAKSTFFSDHCTTTRLNNSFRTGGSNYNINNIVGIGRNSFPFSFNYRRLFGSGSGGLNPPPIPPPQQKHYTSVLDCTSQLVRNEGVMALWKGYTAALARQVSYSSVMMVLYEPIRNLLCCGSISPDPNNTLKPNFLQRLFSGGVAGGVGIAIFNPFEVVKTQIQNSPTRLTMRSVAQKVLASDGVWGFWAGVKPNVMRTFLVNAAELGTYDQAKTQFWVPKFGEGLVSHVGASSMAGVCSACVSTPADVVKTRMMNDAGSKTKEYTGILHAIRTIHRLEGISAFWKGFAPICVRKMFWVTAFFVSYERIRVKTNEILLLR